MSQHERDKEDRALEALIVSQLRRERECCDINDLPELTAEERAVMNAAPADLIQKLWEQAATADLDAEEEDDDCEAEVDEDLYVGMNRADGPTDETHKKLDEARKEVIEELKKRKKKGNGGDAKP